MHEIRIKIPTPRMYNDSNPFQSKKGVIDMPSFFDQQNR